MQGDPLRWRFLRLKRGGVTSAWSERQTIVSKDETKAAESLSGDEEAVEQLGEAYRNICSELAHVVVGQHHVVEELMIAMLAGGHCLLVGVPGLAKTLMVRTLADTLSLSFNRVQFTPDLMPADITGTEVIQEDKTTGTREFRFLEGPVFANVVLADEINRTPPKTQAALLEAMEEHQVTAGGRRHKLPNPFFVLATQNPIEQEGTYPLPEAQLDRFMFEIRVDYPEENEEFEIVRRTTVGTIPQVKKVLTEQTLASLQTITRSVPVADHIIRYAMQLSRLTRRGKEEVPSFINEFVSWGAGPRASQYLILGAKAHALLHGRAYVSAEDVRAVSLPVLRHRIVTNFNAEAEGVTTDDIVHRLTEFISRAPAAAGKGASLPELFKSPEAG